MSYMEHVKTGAAANRRGAKKDPMYLLMQLRTADPTASKERVFAKFKKAIHTDDELEDAVDMHCFNNLWTEQDRLEARSKTAKARRERNPEEEAARIKSAAEQVRKIVILDWLLPNGKRLGEATFGECRKLEGIIGQIGKMGKPHQIVGQKLNNEQLLKIFDGAV